MEFQAEVQEHSDAIKQALISLLNQVRINQAGITSFIQSHKFGGKHPRCFPYGTGMGTNFSRL